MAECWLRNLGRRVPSVLEPSLPNGPMLLLAGPSGT